MDVHFRKWVNEMLQNFKDKPKRAPLYFIYTIYLTFWFGITSRFPIGKNVFEEDWDLLLILDAARVDTIKEVADEYEYINSVDDIWSVGSITPEWVANTFRSEYLEEISRTTYISANGFSNRILAEGERPPVINTTPLDFSSWSTINEGQLDDHVPVWGDDEEYGITPPDKVTDSAIWIGRNSDSERYIVHYVQPHLPYVGRAYSENREPTPAENEGYKLLEKGEGSREEVYDAYVDTLRWVLEDIETLLDNFVADKVVITADHGEAFGEMFGYGHPEGFLHPSVRKVPWIETEATDTGSEQPDVDVRSSSEGDIEQHLENLGYM